MARPGWNNTWLFLSHASSPCRRFFVDMDLKDCTQNNRPLARYATSGVPVDPKAHQSIAYERLALLVLLMDDDHQMIDWLGTFSNVRSSLAQ